MLDFIKGLFDLTRVHALIILFIAFASGIYWFGWETWNTKLTLHPLKRIGGFWIGFIFICSAGFSLVSILFWLRKYLISIWLEVLLGK